MTRKLDCDGITFNLSQSGISCDITDFDNLLFSKKIINHFKIKQTSILGHIKYVLNHKKNIKKQIYIFPRFGFLEYIYKKLTNYIFIDKTYLGIKPEIKFKWTGKYNENQNVIANYILDKHFIVSNTKIIDLASNINKGLILNLEAGQGKTYLATGLIQKIKKKTLVVCHNKTIMHQWIKILKESYPTNTIAHFYGELKEDGDIIVGVINSLLMQNKQYFAKFGFTILDEVHEYCSNNRKQIYKLASSQFMLGLSATPNERGDGLDNINIWNCGQILNAIDIHDYKQNQSNFKGEITMIKYLGPSEYTKIITNKKLDIVSFSKMVNQLCDDPYRLYIIVKMIYDLRQQNKFILIFADRISYLELIQDTLKKFKVYDVQILDKPLNKVKSKKLVGGASAEDIEYAKKNSNVILSTYQYFGTGVSIAKLDSIILTTPRKRKSKQYIGRIFRLGSDETIVRQIIDLVDWNTIMKNQWYLRKHYYNEMQYPITIKKIDYITIEKEMLELDNTNSYN